MNTPCAQRLSEQLSIQSHSLSNFSWRSSDDGACVVQFEVKDYMFNPQGTLHGGVIATVMDISMGHLLKRMSGPGTTLEMKTQYVRPVQTGKLYCKGEFTHRGRGISYLRSSLTDAEGNLIAFATATWKLLKI